MIEDRDYMRQPEFGGSRWPGRFGLHWSLTLCFLIAYLVVFLTEMLLGHVAPQAAVSFFHYLALSNDGLSHGYVWQLVTYQFMHSGWLHLFFNCWAIYVFGLALENELGRGRFVLLMLSSGIVGGIVQSLMGVVWPACFGGSVVGASACAFGLVAAFAVLYPTNELTMLVFFILPVTVQAKVLLLVSAGIAVLGIILSFFVNTGNVANAAHLGGMAMGWFFAKKVMGGNWSLFSHEPRSAETSQPRRPKLEPLDPKTDTDFLQNQVDAILDKISAHGIQSLTARERETLESARKKMTKS
jgi:membrane associated rhomboid family serine protease